MTIPATTWLHFQRPSRRFAGLLIAALLLLAGPLPAAYAQAIITVNSTADTNTRDAELTLLEAISVANGNLIPADLTLQEQAQVSGTPGTGGGGQRDEIRFDIPGAGPHTIQPDGQSFSALPEITDPMFINGLSEPGADCSSWPPTLQIILDGSLAPSFASGLRITGGGSLIRGLVINQFSQEGIEILQQGGNTIECNFIGTDVTGTTALGNSVGVYSEGGGSNNTVGGTTESARNLISGNTSIGIGFSPSSGGRPATTSSRVTSSAPT